MDELSWRVRLAKSNINILNIDEKRWFYEFMYHPKRGATKWCKTYYELPYTWENGYEKDPITISESIEDEVLNLRKRLESED